MGWQCWLSHTELCVASICAFNVFRAESGVPPPVKSWLQTADEKPFYCPPASSISLQRNEMVMAYKAPVVRLNKGLGSIQTSTHKKDSLKYSSMIVGLYNPTTRTIHAATWEPSEGRLWDWHTDGLVDFAQAAQWAREWDLWPRHSAERLWAVCMHACVHVCLYFDTHSTVFSTLSLFLCLALQASPLSLSEGLRKSVRGSCQIRIRAALLIRWKTSHAPCFWMERHSLTCLSLLSSWHISTEL